MVRHAQRRPADRRGRSGDLLIGEAAAAPRIEEAGPDIVPLAQLLTAEQFNFRSADFDSVNVREWSKEECIQVGHWALNVLTQAGYERPLATKHIQRLAILGLSPYVDYINRQFGGFSKYKEAAGMAVRYSRTRYEDWSTADFVQYAESLKQQLGHVPTINDYKARFDAEKGPSFSLIEDRFGGIRKLHDHLGHPNMSDWDQDDFV